jgi:Zn-finger nucleic acid-binding protein
MAAPDALSRLHRFCPSCAARMQRRSLERKPNGLVDLDLCFDCQAIWFDQYESSQLTAKAVIELFGLIHEERAENARVVADKLTCPVCRAQLLLTHDIQRTNRITYYRCGAGHGRFTTFFQFLREKNFVRSLTLAEIGRLKAHVAQVRCSGCGAPVDLARDSQCSYCRSPISILDAEAVKKTLAELSEKEKRRTTLDPAGVVEGLLAGKRFERKLASIEGRSALPGPMDLVEEALDFLMQGVNR